MRASRAGWGAAEDVGEGGISLLRGCLAVEATVASRTGGRSVVSHSGYCALFGGGGQIWRACAALDVVEDSLSHFCNPPRPHSVVIFYFERKMDSDGLG